MNLFIGILVVCTYTAFVISLLMRRDPAAKQKIVRDACWYSVVSLYAFATQHYGGIAKQMPDMLPTFFILFAAISVTITIMTIMKLIGRIIDRQAEARTKAKVHALLEAGRDSASFAPAHVPAEPEAPVLLTGPERNGGEGGGNVSVFDPSKRDAA